MHESSKVLDKKVSKKSCEELGKMYARIVVGARRHELGSFQ